MELPKKYNFKEIEDKFKQHWKDHPIFITKITPDLDKPVYSVDTPPPYVSGKMHMGHALSYAQGDFILRYQRLKGNQLFYHCGTDDNGLPTERYIEKLKNLDSKKMPREEFVHICSQTVKEILPELVQPWIDLGIGADFNNAYSTIDDNAIETSQLSFIDLYNKKLVYRTSSPTVWCTKCQTAIAQAEFENIEKTSVFYDIAFSDEENNNLIIATTRPELIPACVAIFAHPEDERYAHLKNKKAKVPLFNYEVPILFDTAVEKDKGTGLMMVCTFGDKEDVEKWHKHQLDLRVVICEKGILNELAKPYDGLSLLQAREKIVQDLKDQNKVLSEKPIQHNTNVHERCGTEIEFLKTSQWFIDVMNHKDKLISAGEEINWYPSHMKTRYSNWVKNLNWDWCISRQRHFGVPFPVWYEKDTGNPVVAKKEDLPIYPVSQKPSWYEQETGKSLDNLEPELDVMDTWATSSVSPQIALHQPKLSQEEFNKVFPMSLRMQAHDIIRTWTFYTIVKGLYNHNALPWKNIMISGFVLDAQGKKMSKSKGNAIDPIEIMDKYGADVVRYSASAVKLGEDLPFQEKYLETGKKLLTKLFNAAKFTHMQIEDYQGEFDKEKLLPIDKWIITKLSNTILCVTKNLDVYEFAKARADLEKFFWQDFCDNYLEIVKERTYKPEIHGEESKYAGQMTLKKVLNDLLICFAPYLPYLTEEIYSWKFAQEQNQKTLHTQQWPIVDSNLIFEKELQAGELACIIIGIVRGIKSREHVSQKHEVLTLNIPCLQEEKQLLQLVEDDIKRTCSIKEIIYLLEETSEPLSSDIELDYTLAPKEE